MHHTLISAHPGVIQIAHLNMQLVLVALSAPIQEMLVKFWENKSNSQTGYPIGKRTPKCGHDLYFKSLIKYCKMYGYTCIVAFHRCIV